jgi:endonuclease YncB( thermonuclease family)
MNRSPILFALCLCLLFASPALAWEARVVDVADGDTITVEPVRGGDRIKVRLHGIDAPERRQPYGEAARAFVRKAAMYKEAEVIPQPQGKDRYGRIVAVVEVPGGVLQELLLEAGLAWVYPKYCRDCGAWEALQRQARAERAGLWRNEDAAPPWEWRKRR